MSVIESIRLALIDSMRADDRVVLLGQDVGRLGGVFRATAGIQAEFPGRVFDTPLAEAGIVGSSVGLAAGGLVPVAELQFLGFAHQAYHQIAQQLARYRSRSRGRFPMQVTVRAPYGGGLRMPEFHADSLEGQLANTPGLKVVTPAFPEDAYGLLRSAIEDPDPVFFLEPQRLYRAVTGPMPSEDHRTPIGSARLVVDGDDLTLIAWGPCVHTCLEASEALAREHRVHAGVLDLRTLAPMDRSAVVDVVARTRRAVVVHEGVRTAGLGAEISAFLHEELFGVLVAPVLRVTAPDVPYPPGRLEDAYLPSRERVVEHALTMLAAV